MALTKVSTTAIKDEAITLAKLLHGDSNSNGKFLRANNGADPTFETIDLTALSASNLTSGTIPDARFPATLPAISGANLTGINTDLVADTSPQLGGNLDCNGNDIIGNGNIDLNDNSKIKLGTGDDVQIYHTGSATKFDFYTSSPEFTNSASETLAKFNLNGSVDLYHDGGKKFASHTNGLAIKNEAGGSSTSLYVIGSEGQSAEVQMNADDGDDNADYYRLIHFASDNSWRLQNYHAGSWGDNIKVLNGAGVELYHDNSKKFATKSDGFEVRGDSGQNAVIGIVGNNAGDNSDLWRIRNQYAQDVLIFQTYQQANWDLGSRLQLTGTAHYGGLNIDSHGNGQCLLETMYGGSYFTFRTQDTGGNVYDKLYIGAQDIVMRNNDASGSYNYSNQTGIRFTPFGSNNGLWQQITFDNGSAGNTPGPYLTNLNGSHSGVRFYVKVDGGVVNHSGNNSNLCDERMKTNIVAAPSYYNTIKNIAIKKFNYTTEPEGTPLKVGVIAQQVETVEADLVDDDFAVDGSPNDEGTTKMKSVHEEQLFMMSIKALQEAMAKIEVLETKVATLEAA